MRRSRGTISVRPWRNWWTWRSLGSRTGNTSKSRTKCISPAKAKTNARSHSCQFPLCGELVRKKSGFAGAVFSAVYNSSRCSHPLKKREQREQREQRELFPFQALDRLVVGADFEALVRRAAQALGEYFPLGDGGLAVLGVFLFQHRGDFLDLAQALGLTDGARPFIAG